MSDIVERLRAEATDNRRYEVSGTLATEAADTITRLRADIISYKIGNKDLQDHCAEITNLTAERDALAFDELDEILDEKNALIDRLTAEMEQNAIDLEEYRRDVERLRAALEKAEGGFYNMANAIDDYDYHGPAPQCTGDIIGHREQFHRVHVEQLVKYAEECRAKLSGDKQ